MNKFQEALKAHEDYADFLLGTLELIIVDHDSCEFYFVPEGSTPEIEYACEEDYEVDESDYDPYAGDIMFDF